MNDKNIASQNTLDFKELERLKRQMTKLLSTLIINRMLFYVGVDANIVIVIQVVIFLDVNRP